MLQEAGTRLIIPEPSEDLIANEPWSIENYADGLMDELFADIDYILNVSDNLLSQTVRQSKQNKSRESLAAVSSPVQRQPSPESVPVQRVTIPQMMLPNAQSITQDNHKHLSTVVFDNTTVKPSSRKPQKNSGTLGKLLIVGTTLGVAIAGIIYLVQSGVVHLSNPNLTGPSVIVPQPQPKLPTKVDVEADLVNYMLQALAVIDKQELKNNQTSAVPELSSQANTNQIALGNRQTTGNLPAIPLLANNTPLAPNRSGNVVERIYVPVYQPPSPMPYALPAIPGTPTLLPQVPSALQGHQPNVVKSALNKVPQAAKPVSVNMLAAAVQPELKPVSGRTAPITVRQTPKPLPVLPAAVPVQAAVAPESEPTITQQQVYPTAAIAETSTNTLEGLLELGNKSAALFKIDGVTRRINMGESIGSTGWTLVEVSNGEAVIRRNGEVRSIYAGQKL